MAVAIFFGFGFRFIVGYEVEVSKGPSHKSEGAEFSCVADDVISNVLAPSGEH